ncbi:MAG: relaxase/mobilization nuclease domain-containing protein, partial [Eubacterium sp.]
MAVIKMINRKTPDSPARLKKILKYICGSLKTTESLIKTWNCSPDPKDAFAQMMLTKQLYNKESGRFYVHFAQSLPNDISPEETHQIGIEMVETLQEKFFGFEIVMATHTDTDTPHNHFIINTVNSESGLKWHQSNAELNEIKEVSLDLCKAHNIQIDFEVTSTPFTTINRGEWENLKHNSSWKNEMRKSAAYCISKSSSKWDFMNRMQNFDYQTLWWENRNDVTFIHPDGFRCGSIKLDKKWTQAYFETEFASHQSSQESNWGKIKNLSDWKNDLKKYTDYSIHTARTQEELLKILHQGGYEVNWSEKRKHITINQTDEPKHKVRLTHLFSPEEWTKERLTEQFKINKNSSHSTFLNDLNKTGPKAGLYDFENGIKRLESTVIYCTQYAVSKEDFINKMNRFGFQTSWKEGGIVTFSTKLQGQKASLNSLRRNRQGDRWTIRDLEDWFARNKYYQENEPNQYSYEEDVLHDVAYAVSSLIRGIGSGDKEKHADSIHHDGLSDQARKEKAIKKSAGSMIDWEQE